MRPPLHESSGPHYSTLPRDREARIPAGAYVMGGRFEIVDELARGGTAVVYRAVDRSTGGEVALKVVTAAADRAETEARFRNEARLGASLAGHPHVVRPLAVGHLDGPAGFVGRMVLVTELVQGESADVVMGDHGTGLPIERACRIARDIARALVALHQRGIVHRDIKPGNVLLTGSGDDEHARLLDFGLAYATGDGWEARSPDLTADGHAPGTPLYMSPQQVAHEQPTPRFDVYSFGVMLYEFFSGDPPYDGLALGDLLARKCDPKAAPFPLAKICPELPPRLAELVEQCMRYAPAERPSAEELLEVLEVALGTTPAAARRPSRRGWWWLPAAALVLAAGSVAVFLGWPREPEAPSPPALGTTAEPPLASAAYAKTSPNREGPALRDDRPPVAVGSPAPVEPAAVPSVRPARSPRPHAPRPRHGPAPEGSAEGSNPPGTGPVVECSEGARSTAQRAARAGQWPRVLLLTKRTKCWPPDAMDERTRMRTQALFETKRYEECAELGWGSSDRSVARWAATCKAYITQDDTP